MCPAQVNDLVTRAAEVAGRQDPSPELPRDRGLPLAGLQAVCVRGGVLWASPWPRSRLLGKLGFPCP